MPVEMSADKHFHATVVDLIGNRLHDRDRLPAFFQYVRAGLTRTISSCGLHVWEDSSDWHPANAGYHQMGRPTWSPSPVM